MIRPLPLMLAGCFLGQLPLHGTAWGQLYPKVSGEIVVDVATGALGGDVCVASVPARGDSITIVLNESLRVLGGTGFHLPALSMEVEPGGGTVRHTFSGASPRRDPSGNPVSDVCMQYAGTEPVYDVRRDNFRTEDAAHVIAFNGTAVRARGVSRWFPTPFDMEDGIAAEALTYDLVVRCSTCARIYVNGGVLQHDSIARFVSDEPRELFLTAGALDLTEAGTDSIIGESVAADSAASFLLALREIETFYEGFLGVEYGKSPIIVRLDAVRRPRRGQIWGFFSDPSLTLIGMDVPEFVRILGDPDSPSRRPLLGFLAHELAHRYFGWTLGAGSAQRDLFGEPFATYLELKAVRHFFGETEYRSAVRRLANRVRTGPPATPLHRSTPEDFAWSSYRYGYVPFLLFSLEESIGEPQMKDLLRAMLQAPAEERYRAGYDFIAGKATSAGIPREVWLRWEETCVRPPVLSAACGQPFDDEGR